jgi:hypothetical protein
VVVWTETGELGSGSIEGAGGRPQAREGGEPGAAVGRFRGDGAEGDGKVRGCLLLLIGEVVLAD